MVYSFRRFPCSWISFPCLCFGNNCWISFFILSLAKDSLRFMINSNSCFKFLSTPLGKSKSKSKVLVFLITAIFSSGIIMIWLKYCKVFWWFYCADTKDIVSFWFRFLVCLNYFQLLYALIMIEVWLIVCLELRFWFLLLFFVPISCS